MKTRFLKSKAQCASYVFGIMWLANSVIKNHRAWMTLSV